MDSRTGEYITATQAENGAFIWTVPNPLYFKITDHAVRPSFSQQDIITIEIRFNHNLRRALQIHKCFLTYKVWTGLQPQTWLFLRVFRTQS
ncbi:replication enhancer protein [Bitter gourd yellow mosaic virus]|uniref:Replication enhancer n=1 Tax=Bitter gourd yellow mosaic virus TaxID=2486070 RepID=A0A3G3ISX7_9GEMI|nr:replication enhancer protein [Bitter gourd yellow mosaic virus]ATO88010.1 AC3 [Coccinia mosaic Virudhunagar virus]AYQ58882.1 replication enhancer protein [Bitter gourd yellow mosaic virus]QUQ60664.1 replication enhancer protein [Bitter gourd yellow mosaic virus]